MVVTGEDIAALAGLVIALLMLILTMITGNTVYDAAGSMIIVAAVVGKEVHSLLIGSHWFPKYINHCSPQFVL